MAEKSWLEKAPEAVIVEWRDAQTTGPGWEDMDTLPVLEPAKCISIGFLQAEDNLSIVLLQTVSETGVQGRIVIPRGAVMATRRLVARRRNRRRRKGV